MSQKATLIGLFGPTMCVQLQAIFGSISMRTVIQMLWRR